MLLLISFFFIIIIFLLLLLFFDLPCDSISSKSVQGKVLKLLGHVGATCTKATALICFFLSFWHRAQKNCKTPKKTVFCAETAGYDI